MIDREKLWRDQADYARRTKVMNVSPETFAAYRGAFRALGPCHRNVDRWRHDLKWNVPERVIANYLAAERARLITKEGHA